MAAAPTFELGGRFIDNTTEASPRRFFITFIIYFVFVNLPLSFFSSKLGEKVFQRTERVQSWTKMLLIALLSYQGIPNPNLQKLCLKVELIISLVM